ncbi:MULTISPECIES: bifunctional riboflavin kinase/FAD synthetase [unclassified Butyrivibrio]|uniref:bifunctional riboflavin kinase/FAD synthetase n=1 Tax=unclassified Butyrivibrio TaxID=2639466 RepID=UPI000427C862|nr:MULTISPECIES: bifunctional riboflavin kinase/FAD synthetase [unclassified Butyrivibrio]
MRIISGEKQFNIEDKTAIAIGKFDGVHLGHQKLLKHILDKKEQGMKATIFTFDPPPAVLFTQKMQPQLLTKDEKRRKFEEMGVDILVEFPMDMETAHTAPEDFVRKILHDQMNAAYIAAGDDLSYGYKGKGDFALLNRLSQELSYRTHAIKKLQMFGRNVSSSFIKEEIKEAEMERAAELLGEYYYVGGFVEHGKRLGRTLGFPTVNLLPPDEKCLPPYGVYFSEVRIDNKSYHGMTNIGLRPTVSNNGQVSVETFIYDFNEDIYGKYLEIALMTFHRKEQKFTDVDKLQKQLELDLDAGRNFFAF